MCGILIYDSHDPEKDMTLFAQVLFNYLQKHDTNTTTKSQKK